MSSLKFHGYSYPFVPVSGSVVTSGFYADLRNAAGSHSIGIYDNQTQAVATASGNGKEYFIGYSSEHDVDSLTMGIYDLKDPKKTQVFAGKDVIAFEYSMPQKVKNEVWRIGFNGAPNSQGLTFKAGGKSYGLRILLEDNPFYRVFGFAKHYDIWVTTDLTPDNDCQIGCDDGIDCKKYADRIVDEINNHVELQQLGVKARTVLSNYTAPVNTINRYQITLNDGCGSLGLSVVQAAVGAGSEVKVVSKVDCTSVYEVCAAAAPAAITPPQQYTITNCDACPSGYTLTTARFVWVISRPLAGNETLTSDTLRDDYADTVGTAYGVATDADKIFLGTDGSVAKVQLKTTSSTAIAPLLADIVEFSHREDPFCTSNTAPTPVAWTSVGTAYRTQRNMTMTLPRLNCDGVFSGSNRLAEVTAFVAQFADYVTGSITVSADNDNCVDEYTIAQWSQGCQEAGCLEVDAPSYLTMPGMEGNAWVIAPVADAPDTGRKCGIEIYGGYTDTKTGACSFSPNDYYETHPVRFQLSNLSGDFPFPQPYEIDFLPKAIRMQQGSIGRQSGEYVMREYIKAGAYEKNSHWYSDPLLRERFNVRKYQQVDRTAGYVIYYLKHKVLRNTGIDQKQEYMEPQFAIKETEVGKRYAFEAAMLAPLAKHGVVLKQRDV